MALGALEIIVLAILAFIAMISISIGIRFYRGELDGRIQNKGPNNDTKKALAECDLEVLRKRRAIGFLAFGLGLLAAGILFLVAGPF